MKRRVKKVILFFGLLILVALINGVAIAENEELNTSQQSQLEGYPIASEVFTTLQKTVLPDSIPSGAAKLLPYEISKYQQNGYGTWTYGPGLDSVKRLDLMPAAYTDTSATNAARLLNFFTMTDIHISDKESPAQAIFFGYKGGVISGYSGIMLYTTQLLNSAVQTVNALHQQNPFDFGISLGDTCNSTQYNELRWYIDVLDGKNINPDSGAKDDPLPGPSNDYQDEYKAAGLDQTIPWYQALGNHDHFWMGFLLPNDYIRKTLIGEDILNLGNPFTDPLGVDSRGFYIGAMDGRTQYGDIIGAGAVKDFANPPKVLAADPNRRSLLRGEWMSEFFNTSSNPVGHGFNQADLAKGFACYTFEPKSDLPIKVIVLDDTQRDDDPNDPNKLGYGDGSFGYGHGSLDSERYNWLISELDKGQTEGKLMIIAAHIPIGVETAPSMMAWIPSVEAELIAKLHTYPNLLLWIAGHRHQNTVTAFKSPDADHPELGFWQVETSSLREFPQQFRIFQIVRNSDHTISIFTTDVDPAVKGGSFAAISRSYAVAAQQIFNSKIALLPTGSYNAELVKPLSSEMQAKMENYGSGTDSRVGFTYPDLANYSALTWTDAFKAAHDKFSPEYAFGDWKGVDWPGLYSRFLPRIAQAQATGDEEAYYLALHEYVCSIPDGHISLSAENAAVPTAIAKELAGGGFGMAAAELDDGRVMVAAVIPDGPAASAGIAAAAEIITWGGQPVKTAIGQIDVGAIPFKVLTGAFGNENPKATLENYRLEQARLLVRGPVGSSVQVTFKNPGQVSSQTATLTAVDDAGRSFSLLNFAPRPDFSDQVDYRILPEGYGYVLVRMEYDMSNPGGYPTPIYQQFQEAITSFVAAGVPGVIVDLRGNYGGSDQLAADLCGFFYSSPAFYEEQEYFDKRNGLFLRITVAERGPDPIVDNVSIEPQTPYFGGPVVVLVNPSTTSSGEGTAMGISRLPNGKVIGFHGTNGSFGMVGGEIALPGGYTIGYPFGRSVDQNGVIQLDSRNGIGGVTPNPRVPKTLENVLAFAAGIDVELQYAIGVLQGQ